MITHEEPLRLRALPDITVRDDRGPAHVMVSG
jgi:hypothetical protein